MVMMQGDDATRHTQPVHRTHGAMAGSLTLTLKRIFVESSLKFCTCTVVEERSPLTHAREDQLCTLLSFGYNTTFYNLTLW